VADWDRVIAIAGREIATAQVARSLLEIGSVAPAPVLDVLRRWALEIELRMQFLSRRLQETCAELGERGIPFMLLKGAALGALFDPTFRLRPMSDVDILVRQANADEAAKAVEASGWSATRDEVLHGLLAGAHHLPPFLDARMPGIRVELHVAHLPFANPFGFDEAVLWRDARVAPPPFSGALVPSPEHLLLHAAIHFAWQHPMAFGAWRTFRLLSMVSGKPGFSWERFVESALGTRATTACYWTLRLASRLSGIAVPSEVVARLTPPTPSWVLEALDRHFIASIVVGEMPRSPSVKLDRFLWRVAIRPRWSGHSQTRHWDEENKWGQAYGASSPSGWERVVRHVGGYRRWSLFLTRTLLGEP
jgi:hypothetical protein